MATEQASAPGLDEQALKEIEKDVAGLEEHSAADAVAAGTRSDLRPVWAWVVFGLGLMLAVFHVYTGPVFAGSLPQLRQGALHLGFALALVFLLYPPKPQVTRRRRIVGWVFTAAGLALVLWVPIAGIAEWHVALPALLVWVLAVSARRLPLRLAGVPVGDVVLAVLGLGCSLYLFFNYEEITSAFVVEVDYVIVGTVGLLLILLAAQRTLGMALVILSSAMLAYAYYGPFLPGFLGHAGFSVDRIVSNSYLRTEAVFGTPIWISATVIFLFLVFAAMLQRTGMERFFTDAALGATGWATGGTAKVGVATSAFSGTITGSSVANTVSNGAFTIPMMKKSGYKANYAGAVEAASSTGGQIAPPIMGAGAFIMIEFTGVPYSGIIQAALIPAILFFIAQFVVIHYDSKKFGIMGIPKRLLPSVRRLMGEKGYLVIPIVAIFVLLFIGFSPGFAAMGAIVIAVGTNLAVQVINPLVGLAPRRAGGPRPAQGPRGGRLVGAGAILAGAAVVTGVGLGGYWLLGAAAPGLDGTVRLVVVSIVVGTLFALVAQAVDRWRGDDRVPGAHLNEDLKRVLRLVVPVAVVVALYAVYFLVEDGLLAGMEAVVGWLAGVPGLGAAVEWTGLVRFSAEERGIQILVAVVAMTALALVGLALFRRWGGESVDQIDLRTMLDGLVGAARIALPIIIACAAAGMIAGVITLTGLGLKLSGGLVALGEPVGNLLDSVGVDPTTAHLVPVMVLSMFACLILGIGLPTTANYVITATLAAPAIITILQGDLPESTTAMLLMAHMFVYYFGVMADITPPVCLAAYAASGISGGNPIRTGGHSVRIAVSGFVVPFMFVLNPALLLQEVTWWQGIAAALTGIVGACLVSVAVVGFINARINWVERALLAVAGVALLYGAVPSVVAGTVVAVAIFALHYTRHRGAAAGGSGAIRATDATS